MANTLPQEQVPGSGPEGTGGHVVREGECMSSLAAQKGLFVAQIFEHPANTKLSVLRGDPNILLPGDRVTIPPFQEKEVGRPTEEKNKFQLLGEPVFLRIQVLDRDVPLGNQPFTLIVGSLTLQDITKPDGTLEAQIPPTATSGLLRVGVGADQIQMKLKLGALSPVAAAKGVQQRLQNLGFDCGPIDGVVGKRTRAAVANFQEKVGLPADGIIGPETRAALRDAHGC